VISGAEFGHILTDLSYDPGNLVTQHRRRRDNIVSSEQQVRVAQARRFHVDENFVSYRRGDLNFFEIEASTYRVKYQRIHLGLLSRFEDRPRFEKRFDPIGTEFAANA
jgi:glucan phosphorylase